MRDLSSLAIIAHSPRTVRIALGDHSVEAGGAELQLAWAGRVLRDRGWRVTFVTPQDGSPVPLGEHDGFSIVAAHRAGEHRGPSGYLRYTVRDYWAGLAAADASVYLHRGATGLAGWTALFCRLKHRHAVLSVAANSDLDPNLETGERRPSRLNRQLYGYFLRHCHAVLVQSPEQLELLRVRHGREGVWVPNIASVPRELPQKSVRPLVVWAGAIRKCKRPLWVTEVAALLPTVRFVVAGGPNPGEDKLWAAVQAAARNLPNVELRGWLPVAEVERLAGEAWALLCTSLAEGFPNVYLMAWGRGTPVVTSFGAGGLVGRSGGGVVADNPVGLASALGEIVTDRAGRERMGVAGRSYALRQHGPEAVGASYDQALRELLDTAGAPSRRSDTKRVVTG